MSYEPCLCGDPYCQRCFPRSEDDRDLPDPDALYDRIVQDELDSESDELFPLSGSELFPSEEQLDSESEAPNASSSDSSSSQNLSEGSAGTPSESGTLSAPCAQRGTPS